MTNYSHVRALERGLDVLKAINETNGAHVAAISEKTGVHRTTVYRILSTLIDLGYVRHCESSGSHYLTKQVRALSAGFDQSTWMHNIASPILRQLYQKVTWPSDLAAFEGDSMVILDTTHSMSPFSVHHAMVGRRLPVVKSSVGRAYLAFSSQERQARIIEVLRSCSRPDEALASDERYMKMLLARTREEGYASSYGEVESNIGSLALPIMWQNEVLACINLVFFVKAMSIKAAVSNYLPLMGEAVAAIESGLRARPPERTSAAGPIEVDPASQYSREALAQTS